ncbi:hypothetical protein [Leifsonia shinshuensis]
MKKTARGAVAPRTLPVLRRIVGMTLVGVLAATAGCTAIDPGVESATRALESVVVRLAPSGEIRSLHGTTVLLDEATGATSSTTAEYGVAESVDRLPVRLTTRYRTDGKAGSDLAELAGFSGRVEIELTLENLLVSPEAVTYDVVGESRTTPALVGTPLTIAASAVVAETSPASLVVDADSQRRTNGVVSATADGASVVQWGALLAPPQSTATTAFRLVADVKDFVVPTFDIAVQAGLHTDLDFAGVLGSAFSAGAGTELAMQQNAIALVGDVNDVLTRAGGTITAVRKNLDDTSGRLGARALQTLRESTRRLPAEMTALTGQLASLETRLDGSLTGASSAMNAELAGIVRSMSALFGDTSASPSSLIDGAGCAATMRDDGTGGDTVFSMFLRLSALLDGYADTSESCRDEILAEVNAVVGPEVADQSTCDPSVRASATCALHQARQSVVNTLVELVEAGRAIVDGLDTAALDDGQAAQALLDETLTKLDTAVNRLGAHANDRGTWSALLSAVETARTGAGDLGGVRGGLVAARAELADGQGTAREQQETIAGMLCGLIDSGVVSDEEQVEAIRAQITGTQCDDLTPQDASDVPAGGTSLDRMAGMAAAIDSALAALDADLAGSPLAALNAALASLHAMVTAALDSIDDGSSGTQRSVVELRALVADAVGASAVIGERLQTARQEQASFASRITDALVDGASRGGSAVTELVDERTAALNARRNVAHADLSASYQSLIDGLRSSADKTLGDGRALVEDRKSRLEESRREASGTLDRLTVDALAGIDRTISASVRDVDGASALLTDSLNNVLLDLGDPAVTGVGILGAMSSSAALTGTADYQLAQASQHASGYANVREEDIAGILLRIAQFQAALGKTASLPAFRADLPGGVSSETIYSFSLGGDAR